MESDGGTNYPDCRSPSTKWALLWHRWIKFCEYYIIAWVFASRSSLVKRHMQGVNLIADNFTRPYPLWPSCLLGMISLITLNLVWLARLSLKQTLATRRRNGLVGENRLLQTYSRVTIRSNEILGLSCYPYNCHTIMAIVFIVLWKWPPLVHSMMKSPLF